MHAILGSVVYSQERPGRLLIAVAIAILFLLPGLGPEKGKVYTTCNEPMAPEQCRGVGKPLPQRAFFADCDNLPGSGERDPLFARRHIPVR